MNTLGDKLKYLRNRKEVTQKELAAFLQIPRDTLANWEVNRGTPSLDMVANLAYYFKVSADYLVGLTDIVDIPTLNIKLPILGTIRAGLPILADENFEGELEVPADVRADFALEVRGDSMIGVGILEYDYVLCRECQAANSGDIVVALHDIGTGYSEATLKYYYNNGGQILKAANPKFEDIALNEEYRIVAKMVALVRKNTPSYQTYKDFLVIKDNEAWTEIIEKATGYGITPEQLSQNIDMQWQMIEKMRAIKKRKS